VEDLFSSPRVKVLLFCRASSSSSLPPPCRRHLPPPVPATWAPPCPLHLHLHHHHHHLHPHPHLHLHLHLHLHPHLDRHLHLHPHLDHLHLHPNLHLLLHLHLHLHLHRQRHLHLHLHHLPGVRVFRNQTCFPRTGDYRRGPHVAEGSKVSRASSRNVGGMQMSAGMQKSGDTLVQWCFTGLSRKDRHSPAEVEAPRCSRYFKSVP